MQNQTMLDALPLAALFAMILLLVVAAAEGGYRLGRYRGRSEDEKEAPVGAMVGATLGLLAFILAFTFGLASQRFDTRKQLVLDEANSIGTTYLRAAMLPERREEIRSLLREYVDVRLEAVQTGNLAEGVRRSEALLDQLWAHAVSIGEKHAASIVVGLYIQTLNETIDLHTKRLTAVRNRIPGSVWMALFAVSLLSFAAMGYHAGLSRTSRSLAAVVVAVAFSTVIWLIADLDRPHEGSLKVSQQAMIDLRQSMRPPKP